MTLSFRHALPSPGGSTRSALEGSALLLTRMTPVEHDLVRRMEAALLIERDERRSTEEADQIQIVEVGKQSLHQYRAYSLSSVLTVDDHILDVCAELPIRDDARESDELVFCPRTYGRSCIEDLYESVIRPLWPPGFLLIEHAKRVWRDWAFGMKRIRNV